jgi:hypothetical protein
MFYTVIALMSAILTVVGMLAINPKRFNAFFGVGVGIVAFFLHLWLLYTTLPSFSFWGGEWYAFYFLIVVIGGASGFLKHLVSDPDTDAITDRLIVFFALVGLTQIGMWGLTFFSTNSFFYAEEYHDLLHVEESTFDKDIPLASTSQIRLTSWETAWAKATKILGESKDGVALGSQLRLDASSAAIQEVKGEMLWVIPLDFTGFFRWNDRREVDHYVTISATDPNAQAQLVSVADGLKYTPGAYFGSNADRKVWENDPSRIYRERTAEVDENGKLFYVYSLVTPTIGFDGFVTEGVAILDPVSGAVEIPAKDEIPAWVDRVKPAAQAVAQIDYWGEYGEGWWNATFSGANLREASDDVAHFVRLGDRNYWFAGITSKSAHDDALIGMMFVDTRSLDNRAIFYTMSGVIERGAAQAAESALGADSTKWNAVEPVPYNIHGVPTFVVPVVAESTHLFEQVALVNINDVGVVVVAENLQSALRLYATKLAEHGGKAIAPTTTANTKTLKHVEVVRTGITVEGGTSTHLFQVVGYPEHIFAVAGRSADTTLAPLLTVGDYVTLTFEETEQEVSAVSILQIDEVPVDGTSKPMLTLDH